MAKWCVGVTKFGVVWCGEWCDGARSACRSVGVWYAARRSVGDFIMNFVYKNLFIIKYVKM